MQSAKALRLQIPKHQHPPYKVCYLRQLLVHRPIVELSIQKRKNRTVLRLIFDVHPDHIWCYKHEVKLVCKLEQSAPPGGKPGQARFESRDGSGHILKTPQETPCSTADLCNSNALQLFVSTFAQLPVPPSDFGYAFGCRLVSQSNSIPQKSATLITATYKPALDQSLSKTFVLDKTVGR
jgi:hypothetical protein